MEEQTFDAQDKADIIQRYRPSDIMKIGDAQYPVRPLSGVAAAAIWGMIDAIGSEIGLATNALVKSSGDRAIGDFVTELVHVAATQHDKIMDVMVLVLQRSTPGLDKDTMLRDMDYVDDLERFWEIFSRQNKMDKIAKKMQAVLLPAIAQALQVVAARIPGVPSAPGSSSSRISSATTTDGRSTGSSDVDTTVTVTTS